MLDRRICHPVRDMVLVVGSTVALSAFVASPASAVNRTDAPIFGLSTGSSAPVGPSGGQIGGARIAGGAPLGLSTGSSGLGNKRVATPAGPTTLSTGSAAIPLGHPAVAPPAPSPVSLSHVFGSGSGGCALLGSAAGSAWLPGSALTGSGGPCFLGSAAVGSAALGLGLSFGLLAPIPLVPLLPPPPPPGQERPAPTQPGPMPSGAPETGMGGSHRYADDLPLAGLGILGLVGAAVTVRRMEWWRRLITRS